MKHFSSISLTTDIEHTGFPFWFLSIEPVNVTGEKKKKVFHLLSLKFLEYKEPSYSQCDFNLAFLTDAKKLAIYSSDYKVE